MRRRLNPLVLLHGDPLFLRHLGAAAVGSFDVAQVEDWDELTEACRGAAPGAVVVVDPYWGTEQGRGLAEELPGFLWRFPSASVVATFRGEQGSPRDVWTLSRMGVSEILYLDEENTPALIRHRLLSVRVRLVREIVEGLHFTLPGRSRAILAAATEVVAAGGQVSDLARALCMSRQTLVRQSRQCGLPAPRSLLRWIRALYAAAMLDDPGRTVRSVSEACGYADDRGLRRLFQGLADGAPTTLRAEGAFPILEAGFRRAMAEGGVRVTPRLRVGAR